MNKTAMSVTGRIVEEVAQCGIKLVASLPDTWISDLIEAFDRDQRFVHVPVNRFVVLEVEPIGKKLKEPPIEGPEMKHLFGRSVERAAGIKIFDE